MNFEIERAESFYAKASECLDPKDRKNLIAAQIMASVYHAILKKIRKNPSAVLESRVRIPRALAFLKALQVWLGALA